jgi:hypothetical protein
MVDARIQFIEHQGQQILMTNLSHCFGSDLLAAINTVQDRVTDAARGSLLVLADFTAAHFDKSGITRLKEVLVLDRPYVKHVAWVGTDSLPKVFYDNLKSFSQRELPSFETREEAMHWLVKDSRVAGNSTLAAAPAPHRRVNSASPPQHHWPWHWMFHL